MNVNQEYFLNRNNNINRKKHIYFQTIPKESKTSLEKKNIQLNNNSFFVPFHKKKKSKINKYITPQLNTINYSNNRPKIKHDISGFNSYIINEQNNNIHDTIEVPKKNKFIYFNTNNSYNIGISNYLKNIKINSYNKKIKNNKKINITNNSNNYSSSFYNNDEIEYMNMKLNFKILEQKLSHLNKIVLPNEKYISQYQNKNINKTNYNNTFNDDTNININNFPLRELNTDAYYNNKLKKFIEKKNNEEIINPKDNKEKKLVYNLINNNNKYRINYNPNDSINININKRPLNLKIETNKKIIRNILNDNDDNLFQGNKESDELSELANNLVDIMNKKLNKNDFIKGNISFNNSINMINNKYNSISAFNKHSKIKNKINIRKNNKYKNDNFDSFYLSNKNIYKSEYSITNLEEIVFSPNKRINNNNNLINNKKVELIVEHTFSYNHFDDNMIKEKQNNILNNNYINNDKKYYSLNEENQDKNNEQKLKNKNIKEIINNNDLNNKENISEKKNEEKEPNSIIENENIEKNSKENIIEKEHNNNRENLFRNEKQEIIEKDNNINIKFENSDEKTDEEGEKIINSLIARASQNIKNEENAKNNKLSNEEKSISNVKNEYDEYNDPSKKINKIIIIKEEVPIVKREIIKSSINKNKKVTFDENLIYINYNQNHKVTKLNISDINDNPLSFKSKDLSKYLKILASNSNTSKIKPIIINSNKVDVDNIIKNIKNKNRNKKINKDKKKEIIKRNIDFIKVVQERGYVYNISKEKNKKKIEEKDSNRNNVLNEDLYDNDFLSNNLKSKDKKSRNKNRSSSNKNKNKK